MSDDKQLKDIDEMIETISNLSNQLRERVKNCKWDMECLNLSERISALRGRLVEMNHPNGQCGALKDISKAFK